MERPKDPHTSRSPSDRTTRLFFIILAVGCTAAFQAVYLNCIAPLFSYMGWTYSVPRPGANAIAWVLALAPSSFLPVALRRPSDFILWLLYICIYVPSSFVPLYLQFRPASELLLLDATLLVGMGFMVLILRREAPSYSSGAGLARLSGIMLWGLYILCSVWIVATFRSSLRLVPLTDVYGLRLQSASIFAESNIGYAVQMMYCSVNPLLIASGLQNRKRFPVLAGVGGQLLCYSTAGAKVIVFSFGVLIILQIVVRRRMRNAGNILMFLAVTLLICTYVFGRVTDRLTPYGIALDAFVGRSMAEPGVLTGEYQDYFSRHPHLFLAGMKPFSWVLRYPLDKDVIFAISDEYQDNLEETSNANFWAQDGIANFGLIGIVIFSILTAGVLRVMDRISARHDPCFATMVFIFTGFNLCNGSLPTALLSGGLMLSMILMSMMDTPGSVKPAQT